MVEEAGMRLSRGRSKITLDSPASIFVNRIRNFVKRKLKEVTVATRSDGAPVSGEVMGIGGSRVRILTIDRYDGMPDDN